MFGKDCPLVVYTARYTLWFWKWLTAMKLYIQVCISNHQLSEDVIVRSWPFTWRSRASAGHDAAWPDANSTSFSEPPRLILVWSRPAYRSIVGESLCEIWHDDKDKPAAFTVTWVTYLAPENSHLSWVDVVELFLQQESRMVWMKEHANGTTTQEQKKTSQWASLPDKDWRRDWRMAACRRNRWLAEISVLSGLTTGSVPSWTDWHSG